MEKTERLLTEYFQRDTTSVFAILERVSKIQSGGNEQLERLRTYVTLLRDVIKDENAEFHVLDLAILHFVDSDLLESVVVGATPEIIQAAIQHVELLCASMNILPGCTWSAVSDFVMTLRGTEENADPLRFLHAARQVMSMDKRADVLKSVLGRLLDDRVRLSVQFSWDDALLLTLLIHACWWNLRFLSPAGIRLLFQSYFYRGFVVGVPMKQVIETYVDEFSGDLLGFTDLLGKMQESLKNNDEKISIAVNSTPSAPLISFLTQVDGESNRAVISVMSVGTSPVMPSSDITTYWLTEAKLLYRQIDEFAMMPVQQLTEMNEGDKARLDRTILIWRYLRNDWDRFASYFMSDKKLVVLRVVLEDIKKHFNPENQKEVDTLLSFSEFLHEKKLLSDNTHLLYFDEKTQTFTWADLYQIPEIAV